jgi:hypothetical protein
MSEKGFENDSPIKWFYHLRKKDKKLFDYAKKKLINAINKFVSVPNTGK